MLIVTKHMISIRWNMYEETIAMNHLKIVMAKNPEKLTSLI